MSIREGERGVKRDWIGSDVAVMTERSLEMLSDQAINQEEAPPPRMIDERSSASYELTKSTLKETIRR